MAKSPKRRKPSSQRSKQHGKYGKSHEVKKVEEQEKQIPGILIVTHGNFGEELIKSAEMIVGAQQNVKALSLLPSVDPEDFVKEIAAALSGMSEETLIMSDLFGGTPSNASAAIISHSGKSAVTGVNMPMLIEALTLRLTYSGEELALKVIAAGMEGCLSIGRAIRQPLVD